MFCSHSANFLGLNNCPNVNNSNFPGKIKMHLIEKISSYVSDTDGAFFLDSDNWTLGTHALSFPQYIYI